LIEAVTQSIFGSRFVRLNRPQKMGGAAGLSFDISDVTKTNNSDAEQA